MYIAVIIIWSTTPLAIKLSNDSVSPIAAAGLRMVLAASCALVIVAVWRRARFLDKRNLKSYFIASLGLFPNLPLVYYAAQYIPSGLIAVIFAVSPFVMGVAAYVILGEKILTPRKVLALLLATVGLVIIFIDQMAVDENAVYGVVLMLLSTIVYSFSSIEIKRLGETRKINAFDQTTGALLFSLPGLILCWFFMDGDTAVVFSETTILSVVYLALVGSLIGFVAFFYVLNHMSVSMVSIIPMMTPALALWVGAVAIGEVVSSNVMVGTSLIIFGLILYESISMPKNFKRKTQGVKK
jgi:drug/metabolite transporter (DMT)-like permease